jgi:DNA processing protein
MTELSRYSVGAKVWALKHHGGIGPRTFRALFARFRSLEGIHAAEMDELTAIEGLGLRRSKKIYESSDHLDSAEEFIRELADRSIDTVTLFDGRYPDRLLELNDPPPLIFSRGDLPTGTEKTVAIIGSRRATSEGIARTVDLAGQLAGRGISVVSGLAQGIDAAAHVGALKAGGKSYAVLGSGFDNIHPAENRPLAVEMEQSGGLISEYPPEAGYSASRNIARNRLTVGLSQAVVIGQALEESKGTLDSAKFCHEIGKLLFIILDRDNIEKDGHAGIEKALNLGAIPISMIDGAEIIAKSLV